MLTSVPAGTALAVRISESLSTEKSAEGDTFSGSLAKDLVIDGKTLAPAGSEVSGVVYHSVRSGKVKGLAELGLRLRYQIVPNFAPYVGVAYERAFGDTRSFLRADGDDPSSLNFVVGLRTWF